MFVGTESVAAALHVFKLLKWLSHKRHIWILTAHIDSQAYYYPYLLILMGGRTFNLHIMFIQKVTVSLFLPFGRSIFTILLAKPRLLNYTRYFKGSKYRDWRNRSRISTRKNIDAKHQRGGDTWYLNES